MLFPETIEAERLHLERLSPAVDVIEYHECCSDHEPAIEEVTRYLPWNPHETAKEPRDYIASMEEQWDAGTRAEYVLRPKDGEDGATRASARTPSSNSPSTD